MSMEQLSLWDWMPEACPKEKPKQMCDTWPELIQQVAKDIFFLFKDNESRDDIYAVWGHVPNLGKRYEVWFYNVSDFDAEGFEKLQQAYKAKKLSVSACVTPSLRKKGTFNYMISTMWLTKGHKEL